VYDMPLVYRGMCTADTRGIYTFCIAPRRPPGLAGFLTPLGEDHHMAEPRVQILMDYQNVHLSVAEAFAPPGTPPSKTTLHPGLFGDAVMSARLRSQRTGVLTAVHVFRGQASSDREPTLAPLPRPRPRTGAATVE
jgi:hypothetical protein